jgi:protein-S-isoprenylcysteine O-methyltransferase Ste14
MPSDDRGLLRFAPPPVLFLACLTAGAVGERLRPWSLGGYAFTSGLWAGVACSTLAFCFALWAIATLTRHHTPIEPGHTPAHLVIDGPFRFSRNPIYVSLVVMAMGAAIAMNSLWLLGSAALLLILLDRIVVRAEEKRIVESFGEGYAAYRRTVRRWL